MRIELSGIKYRYGKRGRRGKQAAPCVLDGIGFAIEPGERVALCGKSGSGKTTLLQLLKGFARPTEGELLLGGVDPHRTRRPELFDRIGYVFQYPEHQLFAATVAEDVGFGLRQSGASPSERERKIARALEDAALPPAVYGGRSPLELSGGEKRRAAIAGVLALEPEVLILDEPTAGLDLPSRTALFELLEALRESRGTTIVWVSHRLEEMLAHASRMLALHRGVIVADGKPAELIANPDVRATFGWEEPPALAIARWFKERHGLELAEPWNEREVADAFAAVEGRESLWLREAT
ncbi:energy-coupling factor ABC transporter ATP-binding protein [Paenibacillaceae bacterium WGS1546]|uniref:energy-coupling factor ABC transporter ATP-binding protein n=1 Tax=Cohnella sp. WGS1546 TaxID=3366810 RepID=UPI00372CED55